MEKEQEMKAAFEIVEDTEDRILIRDVGHDKGRKSVTNDAEGVVHDLYAQGYLIGQPLHYIDSMNRVFELRYEFGVFKGFQSVRENEQSDLGFFCR